MAKDLTRDPRDANARVSDLETREFEAIEFAMYESESEPGDDRRRVVHRTKFSNECGSRPARGYGLPAAP
jgi:hypothetical protein